MNAWMKDRNERVGQGAGKREQLPPPGIYERKEACSVTSKSDAAWQKGLGQQMRVHNNTKIDNSIRKTVWKNTRKIRQNLGLYSSLDSVIRCLYQCTSHSCAVFVFNTYHSKLSHSQTHEYIVPQWMTENSKWSQKKCSSMCLCITKQETAHKGQARYKRW